MISNHNRNNSSFRIIEPKQQPPPQFQHAQQTPILVQQHIPVLSMNNNFQGFQNNNLYNQNFNQFNNNNNNNNIINNHTNNGFFMSQSNQKFQMQNNNNYNNNINNGISMPVQYQKNSSRVRNLSDTDSSYIPETTSESGISDLDMSEKCTCCPYGYHIDTDFVTFLHDLGGKNLNKQLKKIHRKRTDKIQRSMEFVIDEVEKIRQLNENTGGYADQRIDYSSSPLQNNRITPNPIQQNYALNQSSNLSYSHSTTPTNITQRIIVPPVLKKTINKIEKLTSETNELFSGNSSIYSSDSPRKLFVRSNSTTNAKANMSGSASPHMMSQSMMANSKHHTSNNYINLTNNFPSANSIPHQQRNIINTVHNLQNQHKTSCERLNASQAKIAQVTHNIRQNPSTRRSFSSCAEPINNSRFNTVNLSNNFVQTRRCASSCRSSPVRQLPMQVCHQVVFQSNPKIYETRQVRSRSQSRRSQSRSPVQQMYRREVKINLGNKPKTEHEEYIMSNNMMEEKVVTTVTTKPRIKKTTTNFLHLNPIQPEVQEEVLLNLFSCNNSGSVSSDSSESLVELEDPKLKINEVYEKQMEVNKIYAKPQPNPNNHVLEKRLAELEKKLRRLPELEIKNNILLEEKQLLMKQLMNMKQPAPPVVQVPEPPLKVFRSIGSNSNDAEFKRDVGTECRAITRDVGITNKLEEPREEIQKMETIITTLRDKLQEQTLILEKALLKPVTRDVAIMHVVDKVEKPKPELRDVAINHRTEVDNKELIDKHNKITATYIQEIDILRIENSRLSQSLEDLIKKHSKHVVTRGTYAPEQAVHYSVGTNTSKTVTRDVQVMFTPKSRDVSMATDKFSNSRDVALTCNIGDVDIEKQMLELLDIKLKYEQLIEEKLKNVKSYRDVAMVCNLDFKERRSVALGCNLVEPKQMRDVSMRCNMDEEFRSFRDVCIECNIDNKVKKDAAIMVNTFPAAAQVKDFGANVQFEDEGKLQMAIELSMLKKAQVKVTRDVGVFVDQRSRLLEDQMRHQSSGVESPKTFSNRQQNTDVKATKDFSVGTTFGDETHEFELKTYKKQLVEEEKSKNEMTALNAELNNKLRLLEEELKEDKRQIEILNSRLSTIRSTSYETRDLNTETQVKTKTRTCSNTDLSILNEQIDHKINNSTMACVGDSTKHRKVTEFEQRKITRIDPNTKTRDDTITMNFSATNKDGDRITESASFTTKTPYATNNSNQLCRTEMNIPIIHQQHTNSHSSFNQFTEDVNILSQVAAEELAFRNSEKKPKGILKSSLNECQPQKKALTFGQNVESLLSGSEQSLIEETNCVDENTYELYETPITTLENQIATCEEKHRRIKTEHSNSLNVDYDDYEIQEQLMNEGLEIETKETGKKTKLRHINVENEHSSIEIHKEQTVVKEIDYSDRPITGTGSKPPTVHAHQGPSESFELELELHIACAILNDSLYEPLKADKNKVARALNLIQQDWFKLAAKKDSNYILVEEHLNAFYSRFSNLLLERIVNMADLILNTALHYSVSNGNFEIVNLLLDTKVCDVNSQNKAGGYTSIMLAALVPVTNEYERMTLKRLFLEGNVNIKSNDNGQTALMLAVMHGNKDTVCLLLEANSDCNLQDKEGSTALMAACEHGYIEIVRCLLNNTNCDPDIKDNDGETAFDIAKKKQRNDIIVLLYAHSSKLRSHHPAITKSRPKFNSSPLKK